MPYRISFWITLVYASCLILFGYVGFCRTGSLMSLYSGGIFGLLLLATCIGMFYQKKRAETCAIVLTFLLTGMFSFRWAITHKMVPIVLTIVSSLVFIVLAYRRIRKH